MFKKNKTKQNGKAKKKKSWNISKLRKQKTQRGYCQKGGDQPKIYLCCKFKHIVFLNQRHSDSKLLSLKVQVLSILTHN